MKLLERAWMRRLVFLALLVGVVQLWMGQSSHRPTRHLESLLFSEPMPCASGFLCRTKDGDEVFYDWQGHERWRISSLGNFEALRVADDDRSCAAIQFDKSKRVWLRRWRDGRLNGKFELTKILLPHYATAYSRSFGLHIDSSSRILCTTSSEKDLGTPGTSYTFAADGNRLLLVDPVTNVTYDVTQDQHAALRTWPMRVSHLSFLSFEPMVVVSHLGSPTRTHTFYRYAWDAQNRLHFTKVASSPPHPGIVKGSDVVGVSRNHRWAASTRHNAHSSAIIMQRTKHDPQRWQVSMKRPPATVYPTDSGRYLLVRTPPSSQVERYRRWRIRFPWLRRALSPFINDGTLLVYERPGRLCACLPLSYSRHGYIEGTQFIHAPNDRTFILYGGGECQFYRW